MGFGPSISVPTITGTQVVYPARLVAVWAVLTVAGVVVERVIRRLKYWIVRVTGNHTFGWYSFLHSDHQDSLRETETYTVAELKDQLDWERTWWRRSTRRGVRTVVIAPVVEELTFRGGPYLLAVTLGVAHLPLLVAGSVLWAFLHTRNPGRYRRGTLPVFVSGLLSLYLWLVGLWWLAILVHAGNNLLATAVDVGEEWWRRWQHSFSPGEEYTVTVDNQSPQPDRDRDTSAYPRLPVSDERSDTLSEPRSEQAGVERTTRPRTTGGGYWISHRNRFSVAPCRMECYGIGEMPSPNHKGWRTSGGSHGDDTDADEACLTGPQPYTGEETRVPPYAAGSP